MELFGEIWSTLRQNKLRTALTGFAVSWGLFMLIALLGAGNGLLNALMSNSGDIMSNSMIIYPGSRSIPYNGQKKWSKVEFRTHDVEYLKTGQCSEVIDEAGGEIYYSDTLSYGKYNFPVDVSGVTPLTMKISNVKVLTGRFINERDMEECRKVMVIGQDVADDLTGGELFREKIIGRHVRIGDIAFMVVGVIEKDEMSGGAAETFVPITTVSRMRAKGQYIDQINASFHGLETEKDNDEFEARLRLSFNAMHNAAPQDNSTIYIWNRMSQSLSMNKSVKIMNVAMWILGMFTLLSGIVGVSNIMLITVRERIHEFGIRKALGATPWGIMKLIVVESVVITALFGYIGMLCGLAANYLMDITIAGHPVDIGITQVYMFKNPVVGIDVAVEATLLIMAAGTLAGLFPAWKASRVRPIEALRND